MNVSKQFLTSGRSTAAITSLKVKFLALCDSVMSCAMTCM